MERVPVEIEVEGLSMALDTWQDLQNFRDTDVFASIEEAAKETLGKGKKFWIYDQTRDGEIYTQCDSLAQVEKLFHPSPPTAS